SIIELLPIIQAWLVSNGLRIMLIIILTWFVLHFMNRVLAKIIRKTIPRGSFTSSSEERKREDTLIKISQNTLGIFIWIAAFLGVLHEFGVPVAPLITGAGILGVAIGFGSQSLVKDIITGLFIIAENQFRIDDYVCLGNYCGTVEDMTLRVTKLRENDGTIHYVPNGEITIASNKSKDFSRVNFTLGVGYDSDIEKLETLVNAIGLGVAADPRFADDIIDAPHFLRVDDFHDHALSVRIIGKVQPKKQYSITAEMRKRLQKIFQESDIDIPYQTHIIKKQK
ncbi:MAG: mechanosensitive ion channel family protein, partial [Minisyncoccia bacterium]